MKKERKADNFLPKPQYAGGPRKMSLFIKQNLKYPKDALEDKTEGTVRIKIDIDYRGHVAASRIMSGVSESCDVEAKRLVSLLEFVIPKKLRKGKIRFHKTLNIKFKLPDETNKPIVNSVVLNYQVIPTKKVKDKKAKNRKGTSYRYILNY